MDLRRLAATAVLVTAALGVGAGTSYAAPATPTAKPQGIDYVVKLVDKTVVTTLKGGTFDVEKDGKSVDIKDAAGHEVMNMPLSFKVDDVSYPYASKVRDDGKTLDLTPPANVKTNGKRLFVKPVASPAENQSAQASFATQFGIATAVGGFTGTVIGALVGCLIGGAPLALTIVGAPVGLLTCLGGATVGAGVGGVIGTIAVGGPALAITGVELIQTMVAPPNTTKWYVPAK